MNNAVIDGIYEADPLPETGLVSAYKQLRPVERVFVDAYISDLQSSAVAAGQKVIDFIETTGIHHYAARNRNSAFHAKQMMLKPLVRAAITERVRDITEAMDLSAFKVLKETANIAMSSVGHYMEIDDNGQPSFDLAKATPEQLAAIKKIKVTETSMPFGGVKKTFEFELHSKLQALDMLFKYMGLYNEDNAQRAPVAANAGMPALTANTSIAAAADMYARTLKRA